MRADLSGLSTYNDIGSFGGLLFLDAEAIDCFLLIFIHRRG